MARPGFISQSSMLKSIPFTQSLPLCRSYSVSLSFSDPPVRSASRGWILSPSLYLSLFPLSRPPAAFSLILSAFIRMYMLVFIRICICIFKHLYESLSCDLIESFERTVLLLILTCLWSSFIISLFLFFSFFALLIADHCVRKIRSSRSLNKNNLKISNSCPGRADKLILKTDLRLERRRHTILKQSIHFCCLVVIRYLFQMKR